MEKKNNNREVSIICWNNANNIVEMVNGLPEGSSVTIFYKNGIGHIDNLQVNHVDMPIEVDTQSKSKNYVLNHYQLLRSSGNEIEWLHMLEDCLEFNQNPTQFMDDIENMMAVLDINSWLNTTTDICNRVYYKYNPRVRVKVDQPEFQKLNLGEVVFCSHSNTQWMVFNIANGDAEELHFNDTFSIAMYYIIEYLARRRNTHPDSMYFMNQYITCKSEENLFKNKVLNSSDAPANTADEAEKMKEEDAMFKALNVNYTPDNNVDMILERLLKKLRTKI